ncbi:AAA family ATPase [Anaerolineales bacterium HSG25]|nr:AAA family ATPase [Anaerolineales bacterium HSG25]
MIKFPYGIANFYDIITDDYLYIDRTDRIRLLEEMGKYILFLRPRRFGKSLWLSTLQNYYDLAKADEFERLFGHLAIGQNPTSRHNQYFVMKWNFSEVNPLGDMQQIQQSLYSHINSIIDNFATYYQDYLPRQIKIEPMDAIASFHSLLNVVQQTPYKLYLLIDEYDNFANEVMMNPRQINAERYKTLVEGEGLLKYLFKVIKAATEGNGLDRFFITGVSPVVMSDVTSAQNIAKNIYFEPEFNDLCGFHEEEVSDMLQQIAANCDLSTDETIEAMTTIRAYYDGYCFTYDGKIRIYNSTLVIYFLEHLQRHCQYPRNMLDKNLSSDRKKVEYAATLPGGERLLIRALDEKEPLVVPNVTERFGVRDMIEANENDTFIGSLLYYLGMLTLGGNAPLRKLKLSVPNLVVRGLYFEQLQQVLLSGRYNREVEQVAEIFYTTGNLQPVCDFLQPRFAILDNRDYRQANELLVKMAFLAVLFNDMYYMIDSELELERGYADLTMIIRPDMRPEPLLDHLIEFKYVSLGDVGLSGAEVRALTPAALRALPPVKAYFEGAKSQLTRYQKGLRNIYGDVLRLHSYIVVSIGFEQVVWENVKREG